MLQKTVLSTIWMLTLHLIGWLLMSSCVWGQYSTDPYHAAWDRDPNCVDCQTSHRLPEPYPHQPSGYGYDDYPPDSYGAPSYGDNYGEGLGCGCRDCQYEFHRPGRAWGRLRSRHGDRFENMVRGRPGDYLEPPFIKGECGDCNWGPVYLSIFAGVSFIDNFDTRFTFDNGMMNMLGVQETGFSILDGVVAGGAIGRYFYRQARFEFEYSFRDNGIGDMSVFTYSDDLTTPQINDTLISAEVTGADGNMQSHAFVWNLVVDLSPRTVGCMNGYLGGGIGVLYVDSDITTAMANFNIDDSAFAFQGIAGVNYPIRDRIDLFTEYRYLGADSIRVDRTDMMGTVSLGGFRFDSHNLVFGMRFLR